MCWWHLPQCEQVHSSAEIARDRITIFGTDAIIVSSNAIAFRGGGDSFSLPLKGSSDFKLTKTVKVNRQLRKVVFSSLGNANKGMIGSHGHQTPQVPCSLLLIALIPRALSHAAHPLATVHRLRNRWRSPEFYPVFLPNPLQRFAQTDGTLALVPQLGPDQRVLHRSVSQPYHSTDRTRITLQMLQCQKKNNIRVGTKVKAVFKTGPTKKIFYGIVNPLPHAVSSISSIYFVSGGRQV
jgi:hypothetical protein